MSYEPVTIFIRDDSTNQNPVEGVVVRVFDDTGTIPYGQAVSTTEGKAEFMLPSGKTFQLRFYKFQTSFQQPQSIEILEASGIPVPLLNQFDVSAHVFTPPEAIDIRLCRVSGFFRDISGKVRPNVDLHILPQFNPILLEGSPVLGHTVRTRSELNGYIELDLIRNGVYDVTVEGFEDFHRVIYVPDAPSINFGDLLFPVVESILFDPEGPISIGVGVTNETVVVPTVLASDGRTLLGVATSDVQWSTADSSIAAVLPSSDKLTIRGFKVGQTELLAQRQDKTIIRIPNTPIQGVPLPITVV